MHFNDENEITDYYANGFVLIFPCTLRASSWWRGIYVGAIATLGVHCACWQTLSSGEGKKRPQAKNKTKHILSRRTVLHEPTVGLQPAVGSVDYLDLGLPWCWQHIFVFPEE